MNRIVFIPGVWDMLHAGHIKFLEKASKFGDVIVVGVESDELVKKEKGEFPIISIENRILALENVKHVDVVVPFYSFDYVSCLKQYNATITVLSENNMNSNKKRFVDVIEYMNKINGTVIYLPYNYGISSTKIKNNIIEQKHNQWKEIWNKVGNDNSINDIKVGSDVYNNDKIKELSKYIINKLNIKNGDSILDFGCGSGLIDKILEKTYECKITGIDISEGMIQRAIKNCPNGTFLVDDHISIRNKFDHITCYGTIHYLQNLNVVDDLIKEMKNISKSIIIIEIPDIEKQELREANRKKLGKLDYPKQLYFNKKFFVDRGFDVFDNEISVTNHSDYGFTALINETENK